MPARMSNEPPNHEEPARQAPIPIGRGKFPFFGDAIPEKSMSGIAHRTALSAATSPASDSVSTCRAIRRSSSLETARQPGRSRQPRRPASRRAKQITERPSRSATPSSRSNKSIPATRSGSGLRKAARPHHRLPVRHDEIAFQQGLPQLAIATKLDHLGGVDDADQRSPARNYRCPHLSSTSSMVSALIANPKSRRSGSDVVHGVDLLMSSTPADAAASAADSPS